MSPDIIVYGVVAAGLIFWLRSILGTKHGDERERPNPLDGARDISTPGANADAAGASLDSRPQSQADRIQALAMKAQGALAIDNKTAQDGLVEISRADKAFDIDKFMAAAQEVFVMVVEAFARGERDTLTELLSPTVFRAFEGAITEREKTGEKISAEIHAIRKAHVLAAGLEGKSAMITIRFEAEETKVVRDAEGTILSGNPDRITKMVDIWTFSRNVGARDPRWLLVETRSDDAEDNDTIPNTDKPA